MDDRWVVFGGWAFGSDLLKPVFGDGNDYVDVNEFMPLVVENNGLRTDWVDIILRETGKFLHRENVCLAGWSTGAIIACGLAMQVPVKRLVLLSATPSFCRRDGFRFGQRRHVLDAMRQDLLKKDNSVVNDFASRCGFVPGSPLPVTTAQQTLGDGLCFLEQVDLLPQLKKLSARVHVYHGDRDVIIPIAAGKGLAAAIGAEFFLKPGGHAFWNYFQPGNFLESVL
jgi:pimeloyl-ACP methyl ester carboxylesterase